MDSLRQSLLTDSASAAPEWRDDPTMEMRSDADTASDVRPSIDNLISEVRRELEQMQQPNASPVPELRRQIEVINGQKNSWLMSLGNSQLAPELRLLLEETLNDALSRKRTLEARISELESISATVDITCDRELVMERLERLSEIMASGNPSRLNVELSLHIDAIMCSSGGRSHSSNLPTGSFRWCVEPVANQREFNGRTGDCRVSIHSHAASSFSIASLWRDGL